MVLIQYSRGTLLVFVYSDGVLLQHYPAKSPFVLMFCSICIQLSAAIDIFHDRWKSTVLYNDDYNVACNNKHSDVTAFQEQPSSLDPSLSAPSTGPKESGVQNITATSHSIHRNEHSGFLITVASFVYWLWNVVNNNKKVLMLLLLLLLVQPWAL